MYTATLFLALLLLHASALTMTHDDLIKASEGVLSGLETTDNHKVLLKCLKDDIIHYWKAAIEGLEYINWSNHDEAGDGLSLLLSITLTTGRFMVECSPAGDLEKKLEIMYKKMADHAWVDSKLTKTVTHVAADAKLLLKRYAAAEFLLTGKIAGGVINWFFLKE